jgi:ubiquinol-cytochrome c reductase cytochrome b subunit
VSATPAEWVDERVGASAVAAKALRKAFPDHWSFLLGEIAAFAFAVLVGTGLFLTLFYEASAQTTVYTGAYPPLQGTEMSAAHRSVVALSFDVPAGLLMRQTHHWAALVFVLAIVAHLCRVFFTGAFRRPRELNWVVGVLLLALALVNGFAGYSLPDDLLAGSGLRILEGVILSIPLAGEQLALLLLGDLLDREQLLSRLFVVHVLLVPAALATLIAVHMAILLRQKHTQHRRPGRTQRNVVGQALFPEHAMLSGGILLCVGAVLFALGGLVEINPVWRRGPFDGTVVPSPVHPDLYQLWNSGALRLFPGWEPEILGVRAPLNVFLPGVVLPLVVFGVLLAWPFLEGRREPEKVHHHLLDRPRDAPGRTAYGVFALTLLGLLTAAGGNDVVARALHAPVETVNGVLQVLCLVLPPLAALVAYRVCVRRREAERG